MCEARGKEPFLKHRQSIGSLERASARDPHSDFLGGAGVDRLHQHALVANAVATARRCSYLGGPGVDGRSAADRQITRKNCRRFFRLFFCGLGPRASSPYLQGCDGPREVTPTSGGIVPAGTGFIMWPVMLHQCWSQAGRNTQGEEYHFVRFQQDKTLAAAVTSTVFSAPYTHAYISPLNMLPVYIHVECLATSENVLELVRVVDAMDPGLGDKNHVHLQTTRHRVPDELHGVRSPPVVSDNALSSALGDHGQRRHASLKKKGCGWHDGVEPRCQNGNSANVHGLLKRQPRRCEA